MNHSPQTWWDFGYLGILGCVFLEQLGIPIPAFPALLAAGALAANGELHFSLCLLAAVFAAMCADSVWYYIGRAHGGKVLNLMCRLSWRPDTCVGKTKSSYSRFGARILLVAKFVPGLNTLSTPLAGIMRVSYWKFLAYDATGAAIWALVPLALGVYLKDSLALLRMRIHSLESYLPWFCLGIVVVFLIWHFVRRRLYLKALRLSLSGGITLEDLKLSLDRGDDLLILDIRDELSARAKPVTLPSARWIPYPAMMERLRELPVDKTLVLYCDCPADQASGGLVDMLQKKGFTKVRPLLGGLDGWIARGYSTVKLTLTAETSLDVGGELNLEPSA